MLYDYLMLICRICKSKVPANASLTPYQDNSRIKKSWVTLEAVTFYSFPDITLFCINFVGHRRMTLLVRHSKKINSETNEKTKQNSVEF